MSQPRPRRIQALGACLLAVLAVGCAEDPAPDPGPVVPSGVALLDVDGDGTQSLEPGKYALSVNGAPRQPIAVAQVPDGLYGYGTFGVGIFPATPGAEPYRTLTYWTINGVFTDPCGEKDSPANAGDSVDDLVKAFQTQRLMKMTPPTPVTVDGHSGVQFDLVAPDDVVYENCADGIFALWSNNEGGGRFLQEPGQLVRMRVLDVDGQRVVISTSAAPGEADAKFNALDAVASGITFLPPE